ncbi:MAG: helix-turn-helix domain-containing protein [Alphaproteobacteria bacterium]|nr:helix-turn-helix domain-containing protein [Alphaproteobacteria bacterium]
MSQQVQQETFSASALRMQGDNGHFKRMEELEKEIIQQALDFYGGSISEAARRLGVGRSTLYRKLSLAARQEDPR